MAKRSERPEEADRDGSLPRLLLVYSQTSRAASLVELLGDADREVIVCPLSSIVREFVDDLEPDLILLNPPAGQASTLAACEDLRAQTSRPIVVLSEEASQAVIAQALAAGIDEYLTWPIGEEELAARVDAMLRRPSRYAEAVRTVQFDGLTISSRDFSAERHGEVIHLSPIEFRLLSCLASAAGRVVTHDALMTRVWGAEYVDARHYLHLYIRYLREKLEDEPNNPKMILSEWGVGYRFLPPHA